MKSKPPNNSNPIQSILFGIILISLSLGTIFWITLIRYTFMIFIIGSFSAVYYILESIPSKNKPTKLTKYIGITSAILLALSLGIQTTGLPFEKYIFSLGVIFLAYGLIKQKS